MSELSELPTSKPRRPQRPKTDGRGGRPSQKGSPRKGVTLTGPALEAAQALAQQLGMPEGEVVRHAVWLMKTILDKQAEGSELLERPPGRPAKRIEFVFVR